MSGASDAPVGRSSEFNQLVQPLDQHASAVLLISGQPGSGRTHLLHAVGRAARERGYQAIGLDDDRPLFVESTTRLTDVNRAIKALLSDEEEHTPSHDTASSRQRSGPLSEVMDKVNWARTKFKEERAIFDLIDDHSPLFIAVDGYMPATAMTLWITTRLIPHVKASRRRPTVLAFADRVESLASLRDLADAAVELGTMDVAEIRAHLARIGVGVSPQLSDRELDAYSEAAADSPVLVGAFSAVLDALSRDGNHG